MRLYLNALNEDPGDGSLIRAALGAMARARGMTQLARENLYRALSAEGNPEFATALKVIRSLGLTMQSAVA